MYSIPDGLTKKLTELLIKEDTELAVVLMSSWLEGLMYSMDYTDAEKIYDDMLENFIITSDQNIDNSVFSRFLVETSENVCVYRDLSKNGHINIIPMDEDTVSIRH